MNCAENVYTLSTKLLISGFVDPLLHIHRYIRFASVPCFSLRHNTFDIFLSPFSCRIIQTYCFRLNRHKEIDSSTVSRGEKSQKLIGKFYYIHISEDRVAREAISLFDFASRSTVTYACTRCLCVFVSVYVTMCTVYTVHTISHLRSPSHGWRKATKICRRRRAHKHTPNTEFDNCVSFGHARKLDPVV